MTTGFVVDFNNGHGGYCVEILRGVTYCGGTFDVEVVDREIFQVEGRDADHPHSHLCFDCSKADSRAVRGAARGVQA